jgi:phycocyanin-associated, rod
MPRFDDPVEPFGSEHPDPITRRLDIMLGRSILASSTSADSRVFVYEVEGLRQTTQTTNNGHAIRSSGTTTIQVPFSRMNDFMQSMHRLGGTIVAIQPLHGGTAHLEAHAGSDA